MDGFLFFFPLLWVRLYNGVGRKREIPPCFCSTLFQTENYLDRSLFLVCVSVLLVAVELYTRLARQREWIRRLDASPGLKLDRVRAAPFARLPITKHRLIPPIFFLPLLRRSNYENRNPDVFLGSLLFNLGGFPSFFVLFCFASTAFPLVQRSGLKQKKNSRLNVEIFRGTTSRPVAIYIT